MSDRVLLVGWLIFAASACGVFGESRPLTGVDSPPDAGAPSVTGSRPDASGPPDAGPPPRDATPERDAAPSPPPDASPVIVPVSDPACWSNELPPQAQPILPQATVADICAGAAAAPGWSYPSTGTMSSADGRANIVGRWTACGPATGFPAVSHAGVEFGANGRWRLLAAGDGGALVPMTGTGTTGYYYLLDTGQLEVMAEQLGGTQVAFARFAVGMDALKFDPNPIGTPPSGAIYARSAPSPLNGNDNLPSVSDGTCSMVGTWDLPANPNPPGAPAATFSFDAAGNFVGGPLGSDLCAGHTMYGTYQLLPGLFELTSNIGLGQCQWWFTAAYPTSFAADCSSVTLMQQFDNCTGGRGYFNRVTTMIRRP